MKFIILCTLLLLIPLTVIAKPDRKPQAVLVASTVEAEIVVIPEAPKPIPKPAPKPGCEQYREIVQRYFGDQTDTALFVASKESGCRMNAVSSTADYCLFQINREPATAHDVELCVKRAHDKYVGGRIGDNNWSAWYAVCSVGTNPQPKYPGIKCQ